MKNDSRNISSLFFVRSKAQGRENCFNLIREKTKYEINMKHIRVPLWRDICCSFHNFTDVKMIVSQRQDVAEREKRVVEFRTFSLGPGSAWRSHSLLNTKLRMKTRWMRHARREKDRQIY